MGKAKKLRAASHKKRIPPTGGLSMAEKDGLLTNSNQEYQQNDGQIFHGLVDYQGSVREATCVTLAAMFGETDEIPIEEAKTRTRLQRMLDNGLLKNLIPRMVDPMKMVRLHAIGALRNISVTGGIDVCEFMTTQNVITPLIKIISETATVDALTNNSSVDPHTVPILEQAIVLLSNLCESCNAAILELTRGRLIDPILLIVKYGNSFVSLHTETLKLLLLITEGNSRLCELFSTNSEYKQVIADSMSIPANSLYVQVLAAGIALNIDGIRDIVAIRQRIIFTLETALAFDAVNVIQLAMQVAADWEIIREAEIKAKLEENTGDPEVNKMTPEDQDKINTAQSKCRMWKENVTLLTLALELIASIAATNEEDEGDDTEWASDDEEAMEEYAASQMETSNGNPTYLKPILQHLVSSKIPVLCMNILQGLVSTPSLSVGVIAADFKKMRIRVCHVVNNLLGNLPWEVLGEDMVPHMVQNLFTLFSNIKSEAEGKNIQMDNFGRDSNAQDNFANDLDAAVTSAIWAAFRRAEREKKRLSLSTLQVDLLVKQGLSSKSVETRMNTAGLIGCVGKLVEPGVEVTEIITIGNYLIKSIKDDQLQVVAEGLNSIFDVFGDERFDDAFRQLQLLSTLENTTQAIQKKLRAESKQMDKDLVAHVKETNLNLKRFIKYKMRYL